MTTLAAVIFPFDTFGNAGTGAGAELLGDALREAVADAAEEPRTTRTHAFADRLEIHEHAFTSPEEIASWRTDGRAAANAALAPGNRTLWHAGSHLGVLPLYDVLGPTDLVVQFDAHLDCYDLHDTTTHLSPGNFLRHIDGPGPRIVNVGHRDLFLIPKDVKRSFSEVIPADDVHIELKAVCTKLRKRASVAKRIWLDLDTDAFDPAYAPAVQHPAPYGLSPGQFLALLDAVWGPKVVGVSISEFDPGRDVRDATLNLLGWLTERLLLKWVESTVS